MWLMTRYGFYSVVLASTDPDTPASGPDADHLMIRARQRHHLEALIDLQPKLKSTSILDSPFTDYRFRIICPRTLWAEVHQLLLDDMDYQNFKIACERFHGWRDRYVQALHAVWKVLHSIQSDQQK